jgi:hypothetical protein
MRRVLLLGFSILCTACVASPITPEEQAGIRRAAEACRDDGSIGSVDYTIDRFGQVVVTSRGGQASAQAQANQLAACIRAKRRGTAVAPVPSVVPSTVTPTSSRRAADRLKELDGLRQQRLISEDEYQATRKRILEGL